MQVKTDKKTFLELLESVQGVICGNRNMPILSNVYLEAKDGFLRVYGTDLEVSVRNKAKAQVLKEGVLVVESKKLYLLTRELENGGVSLASTKNNWLEISQNKTRANMVSANVKDYPSINTEDVKDDSLKVEISVLKDMIEKTVFSVSNDETRYHLNGILFQKDKTSSGYIYRMVSTDGHRLSLVERIDGDTKDKTIIEKDAGVIIPKKGISEIRKLLDHQKTGSIYMCINSKECMVKCNNTIISMRLIDGTFPDYRQFMPKNFENKVRVSREKLISSLKVVSVLTDERSRSITFSAEGKRLEIASNDSELGNAKEELGVEHDGEVIKIGFNAKYLLDVLNSFDEDNVNLEFKDETSPGVIKPELDKDYTCVVMPMRLNAPGNQSRPRA